MLADRLNIFTKTLPVAELNEQSLKRALSSHRAKQDSKTFRERTVLVFGDEAAATEMYFELQAQIRKLEVRSPRAALPSRRRLSRGCPLALSEIEAWRPPAACEQMPLRVGPPLSHAPSG